MDLEAELIELRAALAESQETNRRRMRRLTVTNVVLSVGLLAFGGAGAAYAVAAANSVNSAAIIDGSILYADLKDASLGGKKILDNSITSPKIAANTLTGDDINESTLAIRKVLTAKVSSTAGVLSGDATTAAKGGTGDYVVIFPVALTGCFATAGSASGAGQIVDAYGSTDVAIDAPNVVEVHMRRPHAPTTTTGAANGIAVDSSFDLIVVCP